MPRIWFLNSSSVVLVYGSKYSVLGHGSILEYTFTCPFINAAIDSLHMHSMKEKPPVYFQHKGINLNAV